MTIMGAKHSRDRSKSWSEAKRQEKEASQPAVLIDIRSPDDDPTLESNLRDPFFIIPKDVVVYILLFLTFPQLAKIARVSRRWRAYSLSPKIWSTKEIIAKRPWEMNDAKIMGLLHYHKDRVKWNFSRCEGLTDVTIKNLCDINGLEQANLTGCKKITDNGVHLLSTITTLKELNLSWLSIRRLRWKTLLSVVEANPQLEKLSVHGASFEDEPVMGKILQKCPELHSLDVGDIWSLSKATIMEDIATYGKNLKFLDVSSYQKYFGLHSQALLTSCTQLEQLDVSIDFLSEKECELILQLPNLTHLAASGNIGFVDIFLARVRTHPLLQRIEQLNVSMCSTSVDGQKMVDFIRDAKKLKVLNIKGCYNLLTDKLLNNALQQTSSLEELYAMEAVRFPWDVSQREQLVQPPQMRVLELY